jgi:hypothetical protein
MKNLIMIFVLLGAGIVAWPASGQATNYRVRVISADEAVGYAYVTINNSYHSMADGEGHTSIPATRLHNGDVISAHFVGLKSVPLIWDGSLQPGSTITLELTPNTIESVVVTAKARDRSRQLFRRHVKKVPTNEWYTGFRGDYELKFSGNGQWSVRGKFERNHLSGDDVNSLDANTFTLMPDPSSNPVPDWQIQRYILLVRSIAERAVQLGDGENSNRGMVIKYRGTSNGRNVFLVVKPYFDRVQGSDDSFQTIIHVSESSGIVVSSETVSRTKWGIWNVSASYAVHNGTFIYPTSIDGHYQEKTPTADEVINVDATVHTSEAYTFTPETIPHLK